MSDRTFEYLLNAMEFAALQDNPSKHGYTSKRRAVLDYVARQERDAKRFNILQNISRHLAQAFFWNYESRRERAKQIDKVAYLAAIAQKGKE